MVVSSFTSATLRKRLRAVFLLWLMVFSVWQLLFFWNNPQTQWLDLWLSPDQQGQWYFSQGEYLKAAQVFNHEQWRATAFYAAQEFSRADELWETLPGHLALYHRGNALAHQQRYLQAIDSYRLSLMLEPDFLPARENLSLVEVLAKEPDAVTDYSSGEKARLEADDIVFDKNTERMQQASENEALEAGQLSSEEVQALWMRRLQSTPSDFLQLKFRYQLQQESEP